MRGTKTETLSLLKMPDNCVEAIAYISEKLNTIPEEFRDSVELAIDYEEGYDLGVGLDISLTYVRPMTTDEKIEYLQVEKCRGEQSDRFDKLVYEKLKARYEGEQSE
jgi:hypothetical protein